MQTQWLPSIPVNSGSNTVISNFYWTFNYSLLYRKDDGKRSAANGPVKNAQFHNTEAKLRPVDGTLPWGPRPSIFRQNFVQCIFPNFEVRRHHDETKIWRPTLAWGPASASAWRRLPEINTILRLVNFSPITFLLSGRSGSFWCSGVPLRIPVSGVMPTSVELVNLALVPKWCLVIIERVFNSGNSSFKPADVNRFFCKYVYPYNYRVQ